MSWQYAQSLAEFTAPAKRSPLARLRLFFSMAVFGAVLVAVDVVTPIDALAASALKGALAFVASASSSVTLPSFAVPSAPGAPATAPAAGQQAPAAKSGASVAAPRLVLSPTAARQGSTVKLEGSGFPQAKIQVLWDGSARDMPVVQANANGAFGASFKVPAGASAGYHTVSANSSGGNPPSGTPLASVIFSVALTSSPTPVTTPQTSPTPTPTQASATPTSSARSSPTPSSAPSQSLPPSASPTVTATASATTSTAPSAPPTATATPVVTGTPTPLPYPGDPIGYIDVPTPDAIVAGTFVAWGWAIDRNATGSATGVDSVVLYRDGPPGVGTLLGSASYGGSRPDVGAYFGHTRWNNSGWTFSWTVGSLSAGTHTLHAVMHSTITGGTASVVQTVVVPAPPSTPTPTAAPTASSTPPPAGGAVALPRAPAAYVVPPGALSVSTSAELSSALAASTARDIVLAPGTYDSGGPFQNPNGHRIYSATLGGAVLRAGLVIGGNFGPGAALVRGVAFDVSEPSRTLLDSIVHVWGSGGRGTQILDATFSGHNRVGTAIMVRQPEGLVVQRVRVRDFLWDGILVDANIQDLRLTTPALLEDLDVANVSQPIPKSADGRGEACIWIGNTSIVRRAMMRNCAWMGLWTGTADNGSLHEDLDIDTTMVGVYFEHFTMGTTVQRVRIGPNVTTGMVCEWADPGWGSRPACVDVVIQDATISSSVIGVNLDEGTTRTTVRRVRFVGQRLAAIVDFRGVNNTYYDNDYSGIAPGAVPISFNHP